MRILSIVLGLFFMVVSGAQAQPTELINKMVAIVGDQYILLSDVEEQVAVAQERNPASITPDFRCQVVDGLLTQSLLVHQAEIDSLLLTDIEVELQLDQRIEQILDYMGGDEKAFEEYYGQTVDEVKSSFRTDIRNQGMAEKMRNKILESASVTPSEVKQFFKEIPKDSLPFFNAEVELRELVLFPEVNEVERLKALATATSIRDRVIAGEDFAKLAGKYSADQGSAKQGGDLGMTRRGKFVPEFEAAAYNLEIGETSEIVETDFGFHIIQTQERLGNNVRCRHILIRPEITTADRMLVKNKMDSIRSVILLDTFTFQQAVRKFGDKDWESFHNGGSMVNPNSGNSFFETGDLDPDVYFAIESMKAGDISAPIEFEAGRGDKGYRIVQLVSRNAPHKASLERDYPRIQKAALEDKKGEILRNWLARKSSSVFVQIDPMYQTCSELQVWMGKK
jgi:peptidyl-prolyl cis-trans isomerase SurA